MTGKTVYLDTHVIIWLASKDFKKFPESVLERINNSKLFISPIVLLEMQYLLEVKNLDGSIHKAVENLKESLLLEVCPEPFEIVIKESLSLTWTRDPFDRIIVAQSALTQAPLLTKDRNIHKHYSKAIWD